MAVHIITAASSNTNTAIVDAATQAVLFVNADGFVEYGFGAAVQFTGGNSTLNIAGNVVGRSFNAINLGTSVVGLPDTGGSNWLHVSSSGSISAWHCSAMKLCKSFVSIRGGGSWHERQRISGTCSAAG